jgi:hypothetical protein
MGEISQVNEHWSETEKTLPDTADRADFRNKLEQIKRSQTKPEKLAIQCEEEARRLDELARTLPWGDVMVIEQTKRLGDDLRKRAGDYRRISKAGGFHFLRQCSILWLWDTVGGKLGITTPRKRKHERLREGEKEQRPPHAPVIAYFKAASEFVFGKAPGSDQVKKVVILYRRAGLKTAPAYSAGLLRAAVFGVPFNDERQIRVSIDESSIYILRDGKLMTQAEADEDARHRQN